MRTQTIPIDSVKTLVNEGFTDAEIATELHACKLSIFKIRKYKLKLKPGQDFKRMFHINKVDNNGVIFGKDLIREADDHSILGRVPLSYRKVVIPKIKFPYFQSKKRTVMFFKLGKEEEACKKFVESFTNRQLEYMASTDYIANFRMNVIRIKFDLPKTYQNKQFIISILEQRKNLIKFEP